MLHSLAVIVGCAIVGATAHVNILASGGYASPSAPLQIAVALGLCTGSLCVGAALRDSRWLLAFNIVLSLLAGEAYAVIKTAERTVAERDEAAKSIRDADDARIKAQQRVKAAEASKAAADAAAISEAAKPGCRKECRLLLEGAKTDASSELAAARAKLEAIPQSRSAAPLADRLHIAGWTLDLVSAALASLAVNGLGASLIAFGGHGGLPARAKLQNIDRVASCEKSIALEPVAAVVLPPPRRSARDHAVRFSRDVLVPADAQILVTKLHPAYLAWCQSRSFTPFAAREIGGELARLFERSGIQVIEVDGSKHVVGARIVSAVA